MFRRSSSDTAVIEPHTRPTNNRPSPLLLDRIIIPESYSDMAASVDFEPAMLVTTRVKAFLIEQQIPIYDYAAVDAYMARIDVSRHGWHWRPLRESDRVSWHRNGLSRVPSGYTIGNIETQAVYAKLVPAHILEDVKTIGEKFGDKVVFFASETDDPDPFLLVTSRKQDGELIVFGAWDEPGFGVV